MRMMPDPPDTYLDEHSPLSVQVMLTAIHMLCCWSLSAIALATVFRPDDPRPVSRETVAKVRMLALAFCASVALGNIALRFIFVSFSQMVSAASPFFTMLLMRAMVGKKYSLSQYGAIIPMCGGVMMCTVGELNFNIIGFLAVVGSTLLRGIKSIMQGRLLTAPEDRLDAMMLLYHMYVLSCGRGALRPELLSDVRMAIPRCRPHWSFRIRSRESILPLGAFSALAEYHALYDPQLSGAGSFRLWMLIVLSGLVSFFLNIANFLVTKYTSAVMLQVLGNVKVVLSIMVSLFIFGNKVSMSSTIGCAITLAGVAAYNVLK